MIAEFNVSNFYSIRSEQRLSFIASRDSFMEEEYIDGIVNAVESFNVEDMTNMAENLVSITSLQRHFSSSDETVGGPIDVAVITRAEGFTWVRHKDFIKNL